MKKKMKYSISTLHYKYLMMAPLFSVEALISKTKKLSATINKTVKTFEKETGFGNITPDQAFVNPQKIKRILSVFSGLDAHIGHLEKIKFEGTDEVFNFYKDTVNTVFEWNLSMEQNSNTKSDAYKKCKQSYCSLLDIPAEMRGSILVTQYTDKLMFVSSYSIKLVPLVDLSLKLSLCEKITRGLLRLDNDLKISEDVKSINRSMCVGFLELDLEIRHQCSQLRENNEKPLYRDLLMLEEFVDKWNHHVFSLAVDDVYDPLYDYPNGTFCASFLISDKKF